MKSKILFLYFIFYSLSYGLNIEKIEPPSWFSGFQNDTLELLIYGDNFQGYKVEKSIWDKCFSIINQSVYDNPSYYKLVLRIHRAGNITFYFTHESKKDIPVHYTIKKRSNRSITSFSPSDIIYLLMPDRFADGNVDNNIISNHIDPIRPKHKWGRRGGDFAGITQNMDYFKELGITALWLTPVYENNYPNAYHGYTPTDLFATEPFLGTMEDYQTLIDSAHANSIKIIQDHIVNHIAPSHAIAQNPPNELWLNGSEEKHSDCNYAINDIVNIWGDPQKRQFTQKGWFAGYLADMNMNNPEVVRYMTQHAIWWIESFDLDGIREDTFPYSDQKGMKLFLKRLRLEYPSLLLLGEVMVDDPVDLSYFFSGNPKLSNDLSAVTDFPTAKLIKEVLDGRQSIQDMEKQLSNDFIYKDPNALLLFLDNHDMGRYASEVRSPQQYVNAFTLLFMLRGIPMLYYGNEFAFPGAYDPDNRNEFPGGFSYSDHNIFRESERTDSEIRFLKQFKALIQLRKSYPDLFNSDMIHSIINDSVYQIERYSNNIKLVLLYNSSDKVQTVNVNKGEDAKSIQLISPLSYDKLIDKNMLTLDINAKSVYLLLINK